MHLFSAYRVNLVAIQVLQQWSFDADFSVVSINGKIGWAFAGSSNGVSQFVVWALEIIANMKLIKM